MDCFFTFMLLVSLTFYILLIVLSILTAMPNFYYILFRFLYYRMWYTKRKYVTIFTMKIAFYHPFCNVGNDAEKVLWVAVQALQIRYPEAEIYIYTEHVNPCPTDILRKAERNFNLYIERNIKFLPLKSRYLHPYSRLHNMTHDTIYLGLKALDLLVPDIFVDTTGFSSFISVFKYFAKVKTISYVHHPITRAYMPKRITWLPYPLKAYYNFLTWAYFYYDEPSDLVLVNSSFSQNHMNALCEKPSHLVYPPCQVDYLKAVLKDTQKTEKPENIRIFSFLQFRPYRDNQIQLYILENLRHIIKKELFQRITLVLCGNCRDTNEEKLVDDLNELSRELGLENNIEIKINISQKNLLEEYKQAYIGIHTVNSERFGVNLVEQMAAGLIMVANESEKVSLDVIDTSEDSRSGYLAVTLQDYTFSLKTILEASDEKNNEIRERAKASVDKFSIEKFQNEFLKAVKPLFW